MHERTEGPVRSTNSPEGFASGLMAECVMSILPCPLQDSVVGFLHVELCQMMSKEQPGHIPVIISPN
jgi:hypothetical protein